MRKNLLSVVLIASLVLFFVGNSLAQEKKGSTELFYPDVNTAIKTQFEKSIKELSNSLTDMDPYGFLFFVNVSSNADGGDKYELYDLSGVKDDLHYQTTLFSSKQKFFKYNFDIAPKEIIKQGKYVYANGLGAELVTNNTAEYLIHARNYSYKQKQGKKMTKYTIQIGVIAIIKKPQNGSIVTDLYFYDKDGNALLWDQSWGTKMPKVSYTRVGPGDESSNSKQGKDIKRSPDIGGTLAIADSYSPGYYLPIIEFRGCSQEFTTYDRFTEYEAVLRLEKTKVHWNYFKVFDDGTIIPESSLKTSTMRAGDIKSFYSKKNTVKGNIYDKDGAPLTDIVNVILKPNYSPANFDEMVVQSFGEGKFEFKDVESGVYKIYTEGNNNNFKLVEVCNCPQKRETKDFTYTVDIENKQLLYNVYGIYTNPDLLKAKMMWKNVTFGFPDDLQELPPIVQIPEDGRTIETYELVPPYTLKLPFYGQFSFYSQMNEEDEDGVVISTDIKNENFTKCTIDEGTFTVKKVKVESPHIFAFLEFNVMLETDDSPAFLLFPVVVGCVDDSGTYAFNWNKLDEGIIQKLKNGRSASKTLKNKKGATMKIIFEPILK